jgi:uncharacterized membrane protein
MDAPVFEAPIFEAPVFEAVIVPHRSLSRRGRMLLLGAIGAVCCVSAALFVRLGAWPVGGFSGVELLLAILLLHLNTREARASEVLILSASGLRILRTDARGTRRDKVLPPAWLSAELQERPGRVSRLLLRGGGQSEEVAASLGEAAKQDLAMALQAALHRFQHPVFDNPQLRDG